MGQLFSGKRIRARRRREQRLWLTLRYLQAVAEYDDQTAVAILLIALRDRELQALLWLAESSHID